MRIEPRTIVRSKNDGAIGVTVDDPWGACSSEETPVVYFGQEGFLGTLTSELEVLGPEEAKPDPAKCGMGKGASCCIFLTAGPGGFECERFSSLRSTLIAKAKDMTAKRHPAVAFPACMDQGKPD